MICTCGKPLTVTDRFVLESTDGPVEHATVRCPAGHWYRGALADLADQLRDADRPVCESCGAPAEVRLEDGSTWCLPCDTAARLDGLDNFPGVLIDG